jgi:hypothetical protein
MAIKPSPIASGRSESSSGSAIGICGHDWIQKDRLQRKRDSVKLYPGTLYVSAGGFMATRGKTTFQKRQKEMARKDKQQRKAARRAERKLNTASTGTGLLQDMEHSPEADPREDASEI